jgi:excisionase family DNA binding protein
MDEELSVDFAASCLNVSSAYVRRLIRQGVLPHTRRGTRIVISADRFVAWLEQIGTELVHSRPARLKRVEVTTLTRAFAAQPRRFARRNRSPVLAKGS